MDLMEAVLRKTLVKLDPKAVRTRRRIGHGGSRESSDGKSGWGMIRNDSRRLHPALRYLLWFLLLLIAAEVVLELISLTGFGGGGD